VAHRIDDALQVAGINSPLQLAELEREHQLRLARALMEQGVRLADPARWMCAARCSAARTWTSM
jgi:bifunctional UDP-N-acetylglucosamine pyrophosphorylase/glucosamine-1-phosphate N-acetyltransferase